jgi:hypothetical protein
MSQDQTIQLNPALLGRTHENLFVGDENPADFYALLQSLLEQYVADSDHVRALVEDAAIARWHLWRRQRVVHRHETELFTTQPDPAQWMTGAFRSLEILQRYKNAAELSCRRAYANLEALRKENNRTARWHLSFDLQQRRVALAERKYDDIAPQVKLAASQANQAIDYQDQNAKRTACRGQDRPSVLQKIVVTVENGVTITTRDRSNKDVMAELAERAHHLYPPEQVVRDFKFKDLVPSEYNWMISDESDRANPEFSHFIPLEDWHKMVLIETDHAIGDPPEAS